MKKTFKLLAMGLTALVFFSCEKPVEEIDGKVLMVTPDAPIEASFVGESVELFLSTNCSWTVSVTNTDGSEADWITADKMDGVKTAVIKVTVLENNTIEARTGSIRIADNESDLNVTIPVSQEKNIAAGMKSEANSNSYIVNPVAGQAVTLQIPLGQAFMGRTFLGLNNDSETLVSNIADGTFATVWKTWEGDDLTFERVDGTNVKVTVPAGVAAGNNAVFALKKGEDVIWSWHLWITDYNPDAETPANGKVHSYGGAKVMDRNLGATVTGVTGDITQPQTTAEAEKYYGLYYQFGRKDPFYAVNGKVAEGVFTLSDKDAGNFENSVKNPSVFYICSSDWNDASIQDMWTAKGTKSAMDPCPKGWRLTSEALWASFSVDNSTWFPQVGSQAGTTGCVATDQNAWLPTAGILNRGTGEQQLTDRVYLWAGSNRTAKDKGYCLLVWITNNAFTVSPSDAGTRGNAFPVRCVKE